MPTTLSSKARPGGSIAIRVERGQKENLGPIQQRTDSPVQDVLSVKSYWFYVVLCSLGPIQQRTDPPAHDVLSAKSY